MQRLMIVLMLSSCIIAITVSCKMGEPKTEQTIAATAKRKPNIVVIFADDLGYGDIKSYDANGTPTPNIDSIGENGFISRDFFTPANVCSPSRAALLTGRYPMRNGMPVAYHPRSNKHASSGFGLHPEEMTIAELLKPAGYRSLMVGKWHLGFANKGSHPLDAGFDQHFGIQGNYYATSKSVDIHQHDGLQDHNKLYSGHEIIKQRTELEELTKKYTDEVIAFIRKEKDHPFFVYFSHNIVHNPHRPREEFVGSTDKGPYGDFINELDHSTGRILKELKELNLEDNTIVVFTSDNGANFQGSNGDLNGGKYTTMEGGHIVPAMFKWPDVIPKGLESNVSLTLMDLFPLFANAADVELPSDRTIDGKDILPILTGETNISPHKVLYYYNGTNLQAIRKGKWKLHLPRTADEQPFWHKTTIGTRILTELDAPMLFNLELDRGETRDLANQHPEVIASFENDIKEAREELGDVNIQGRDQRLPPFEDIQEINLQRH